MKTSHQKKKENKQKIKATVVKYEWVTKEVMRNDFHHSLNIIVEINDGEDYIHRPLNYTIFILVKPLKINEEIDVFWYNSKLYNWNSYKKGIFKYVN